MLSSLVLMSSSSCFPLRGVADIAWPCTLRRKEWRLPVYCSKHGVIRKVMSQEIFAQQATLAEAWSLINETFYDGSFNSLDWTRDLEKHMRASFFANDKEEAYSEIASMVQDLNDPYTRVVPASYVPSTAATPLQPRPGRL